MQIQELHSPLLDKIYSSYNPHPSDMLQLQKLLRNICLKSIDNTRQLLDALSSHTNIINFNAFSKIIRTIRRVVLAHKTQDLSLKLSEYLVRSAITYFPYYITSNNAQSFNNYLQLFQGLPVLAPQDFSDQRSIIVYLMKGQYSDEWADKIVEIINSETLVDRKNQQFKSLKVNRFFGQLVVKNFQKIYPQLERLLVRSQSNIEVWEDFLSAIGSLKGIDRFALVILNKIKGLFLGNPQICIKIVNTITRNLTDVKAIKDSLNFVTSLINGQHNGKKKIIYVRMLQGIIDSLNQYKQEKIKNQFFNQIIIVLVNGFIKFTEEEEYNILSEVFDSLLQGVTQPSDDIAKAIKLYLKNSNKYILGLVGLVISGIYRKEHIESLPSVREVFNHFKTQVSTAIKKVEVNWQWLLPIINFLAEGELQQIENLSEDFPIFKISALSLNKVEKKNGLKLILKYIEHSTKQEEEISNIVFIVVTLLLQELKEKAVWQGFLNNLSHNQIVSLISKGLYPLSLYKCGQLKKNKGNHFNSLLLYVIKNLKGQIPAEEPAFSRIVVTAKLANVSLSKKLPKIIGEGVNDIAEKYLKFSLFDYQNDEDNTISDQQRRLVDQISASLLSFSYKPIVNVFNKFIIEDYYKKDLDFLQNFQKDMLKNVVIVKKELQQQKEYLVEKNIHKSEKIQEKKIYLNPKFEVKMMSELEVKQEKYRRHFFKMLAIFDKLVTKLISCFNQSAILNAIWHNNFHQIIKIAKFPQHRLGVLKLVKNSILASAWLNRKAVESKIFFKYAQFFGEFFPFRYSGITPAIKVMEKCGRYLNEFLALEFENKDKYFPLIQDLEGQFIMLFVNDMCESILQNMEFDINLKKLAIKFYFKCNERSLSFKNEEKLFTFIVKNINILATCEHIKPFLTFLLARVNPQRFRQLFDDILNFVIVTKKLVLETINELETNYQPEFQEFIKLKILALEYNPQVSKLALSILGNVSEQKKSIVAFNMKNFVKRNSKETIQKLCLFIKESITEETCEEVFNMVMKASEELYDEHFDQEGLEMFPYFLTINIQSIKEVLFKPVFELLVLKFTANDKFVTLSKLSLDVGIQIIKKNAFKYAQKLLLILQGFINRSSGVSNIIFLGVLAPYLQGNKNLQIIEKRITELFKSNKESEQRSISKCMPDLMSFFKKPLQLVNYIYTNIGTMSEQLQIGQSYLFSGLLKGIGYKQTQEYVDKIIANQYVSKTKPQKTGRIYLLSALVQNFGRVIEIKSVRIIEILIVYMADSVEEIRNLAKRVGQSIIVKMSSYSVKNLLPQLLKGLEGEQSWRTKISYIWILGIMANSSARQLQTSLPFIVPTLSVCLSNAHPTIRDKASEALNLIGETIKNPQISQCVDILIEALQNPFQKSEKALEILLKTRFNHFIDPPSLSIIIPILDYCMRGRSTELKAGSCQVIGSIVQLIQNPFDLLPYLKIITTGLKVALCDPLQEIRSIASMSIGRISNKIGIKEAEEYFKFVLDIIESPNSNSTERQGAAQAHAEMICSQDEDYFEESLNKIFQKLNSIKHSEKEGYILVFLYVPVIRTQQFEAFIKEVNENMYAFVSDEQQNIRNSAMQVEKVLITNYCLTHTDLLLGPLCDGVFQNNWKKRNSALILIGQLLNILKTYMYNTRNTDKSYAYYKGLMAVYIIKDDELQMPRLTANQVWNTYIQNTPKTIKTGLNELVKMWTRWTHSANGVVLKNIIAFSSKYGENYFYQILEYLPEYLKDPLHQEGVFDVLSEFIKRLNLQFLSKDNYRQSLRQFFTENIFTISDSVRPSLAKCLALYVEKMHEQTFFQNLIYPTIDKMDQTIQDDPAYTNNLHLLKSLLNTSSNKVVDRVINKIMLPPMSQFKIEVITNNADRLANHLYTLFKIPATQVLVEQIYTLVEQKGKQNRLSLIIYCLNQVSMKLNSKHKELFIKMINENIEKLVYKIISPDHKPQNFDSKTIIIFINILLFFLNSISISEVQNLQGLISQISALLFIQQSKISSLAHKIYLLLLSDIKDQKTSIYYRQMVVALQNKVEQLGISVWRDKLIFKDYVMIIVKGIAYGNSEIMDESLDMMQFMIKNTKRELVEEEILRIVGPIIRILNYPLIQKQKIRIMELLISIYNQKYKIQAYTNQILSVCLRLLQEYKKSEQVTQTISQAYLAILISTNSKNDVVLSLLGKIKTFGANLVNTFYLLVKSIVKEKIQLPKTIYQKIYEETTSLLLHNEGKLPLEALYYASKISARLGVFLGKPIQKIEVQLKGLTCPYEIVLNYLHFAYYKGVKIPKMDTIEIFIKESPHEKVFYLLRSIKLCLKVTPQTRQLYSQSYIKSLIPQNISGFDDIVGVVEEFEDDTIQAQEEEGQINET